MKKGLFFILLLYLIFHSSGSLYAKAEKTVFLGGSVSWNSVQIRSGISETQQIRPHPILVLSSGDHSDRTGYAESSLDLALSFDEGKPGFFRDAAGNYRISVSPALEAADRQWARAGNAAALFSGASSKLNCEPLVIEAGGKDALFSPGRRINDFTIEFWLYPFHLENGEQLVKWTSHLPQAETSGSSAQYIRCVAEKNRLKWTFINFFTSASGDGFVNIELSGDTPVVPKTWSHHSVRFDSNTGMIEYSADGAVQIIKYATVSGHERGDVYTPLIGQRGAFSLGSSFTGLLDEFNIYGALIDRPSLHKFPRSGRIETQAIDLGIGNSSISKVDARGGRTSLKVDGRSIEFRENGHFRFSDDSEMQFFIRTAENPFWWDNSPWLVFTPGSPLPDTIRGRYVQVAVDFYPSSDGECSPYLEDIRIFYAPNEAPLPPSSVIAVACDGAVQLKWKSSPDIETDGYLVYYGTRKGEYFGEGAILGESPVNAGKHNSLYIDGLDNGLLYYFSVAAYRSGQQCWTEDTGIISAGRNGYSDMDSVALHIGEFSREVTARPLQGP